MRRAKPERMLDGAPMLFGSSRHFGHVSAQAICIGAVRAVEALNQVQILAQSELFLVSVSPPYARGVPVYWITYTYTSETRPPSPTPPESGRGRSPTPWGG